MESEIKQNLQAVHARIEDACKRSGREPSEVRLICVSKTKSKEMIIEAFEEGERLFGENYVQELCGKAEELSDKTDISWQMIGPLQKNKVKKAVKNASVIHSVDSLQIAEAISKEAEKLKKCQDILLEINIGHEESKHGIEESEAISVTKSILALPNVRLIGLMCIPPFVDIGEENRENFRKLRILKDKINSELGIKLTELSMGMSSDYETAIEEGATYVRVGTAIFGARDYSNKKTEEK